MIGELSANTKAILLLTAPLIVGRRTPAAEVLQPREYNKLAQLLHENGREPADLLGPNAHELLNENRLPDGIDADRLTRLLARGLQLSLAVEHWQQRAIWVLSRADDQYPQRLKRRLGVRSPAILYGCGDQGALGDDGLAVVGSRHVDDEIRHYAFGVGELTASAEATLVSGGARGIDQASMWGALEARGRVVGVLSNDLQRAALQREHREALMDGRLALISPYDPAAGFNVGNAMGRNKLIYALANAALVVSSDHGKGGTWAGAVEQLERLKLVPVYVRANSQDGLRALMDKGARLWPNPQTVEEFWECLPDTPRQSPVEGLHAVVKKLVIEFTLPRPRSLVEIRRRLEVSRTLAAKWLKRLVNEKVLRKLSRPALYEAMVTEESSSRASDAILKPAERLMNAVADLVVEMTGAEAKTLGDIANDLDVPQSVAKQWMKRLVDDNKLEKTGRPARYGPARQVSMPLDKPRDH